MVAHTTLFVCLLCLLVCKIVHLILPFAMTPVFLLLWSCCDSTVTTAMHWIGCCLFAVPLAFYRGHMCHFSDCVWDIPEYLLMIGWHCTWGSFRVSLSGHQALQCVNTDAYWLGAVYFSRFIIQAAHRILPSVTVARFSSSLLLFCVCFIVVFSLFLIFIPKLAPFAISHTMSFTKNKRPATKLINIWNEV